MLSSFAMSSIWHGTEPGYHFFFTTLALNALATKLIESSTLAAAITKVIPMSFLSVPMWWWNFFQLSYGGMPFVWYYYSKFDLMHAAFGHFLHWFYPIYLLIAFALPKVKTEKKVEKEKTNLKVSKIKSTKLNESPKKKRNKKKKKAK